MGVLPYIECLVLTCLGSAPFLAVVTYKLDPMTDLDACSSKPCYFVRYVGTGRFPETTLANIQLKNSSFVLGAFPAFAAVENGHSFSAVSPKISIFSLPGCIGNYPAVLGWIWSASETRELPNPALVDDDVCETESVRKKIENHPTEGYAVAVYLSALVMWTILKIAHDWALLAGVREEITLLVGVLSWVFQLLASCASFSWAVAVTDIFVSRMPEESEGNGACYYQLVPSATLTALGAALLLLYFTHVKMKNLVLSLAHGDYLHCKISNVPYRAVAGTAVSQLLLTKGLPGDPSIPAPHQKFPFRVNQRICAWSLHYCYDFMLIVLILPLASGNFFLRITEMAVSHEWSLSLMVLVKFVTMLAAASTPIIGVALGAWMFFVLIQEVSSEWNSLRAFGKITVFIHLVPPISVFLLALSTSGGAWNIVQAVAFHQEADALQQHWEWHLHGIPTALFVFLALPVEVDEHFEQVLSLDRLDGHGSDPDMLEDGSETTARLSTTSS